MTDLDAFLAMGGYAAYVWPAYGVAALVLVAMLAATLRRLAIEERAAQALERARPRRPGAAPRDGAP